jgi:uncharacterized protein YaiI (UPF0178 family)
MSKATAIYIDADACPVKAGIAAFLAIALNGLSGTRLG